MFMPGVSWRVIRLGLAKWHTKAPEIHLIFAFVSVTALASGCFVFARRFAGDPRWRGWAAYSVITGLLTIILNNAPLITPFFTQRVTVLHGQHSVVLRLLKRSKKLS